MAKKNDTVIATQEKTTIAQAVATQAKSEWKVQNIDALTLGADNATIIVKYTTQRMDWEYKPLTKVEMYKVDENADAKQVFEYLQTRATVDAMAFMEQLSNMSDKILHTWTDCTDKLREYKEQNSILHYVPAPKLQKA